MKRSMLFALSLGIWALLPAALFAAGKPNPNSCGTDVPNVSITIDSGSGYKITPDMINVPYVNTTGKRNKISVGFQISNCSYDLTMNLVFVHAHHQRLNSSGSAPSRCDRDDSVVLQLRPHWKRASDSRRH